MDHLLHMVGASLVAQMVKNLKTMNYCCGDAVKSILL